MNVTAVLIARFQTPYLHEGHRHLLNQVKANHHRVVVVLGVSPVKGSKRNPYDFYTRERLLKEEYPGFIILPLADHPLDEAWSANLDQLLESTFPNENFLLYGSRDSFIPFYCGLLPVKELEAQGDYSATCIRNEYSDQVLNSRDFRLGINYACQNTYSKIYPTVDIALFKEERRYLLLGKKKGRAEWRLPGGFVDVTDTDFETAARRELMEECGPVEVSRMRYLGSAKINDWRYRSEEDKIMTLLFATDLIFGEAVAHDDLQKVGWFLVDQLETMMKEDKVAKEHHPLIRLILQHRIAETPLLTQKFDI
jgi:bifunctional NMN adenylyltransferase/nudix hydrolase